MDTESNELIVAELAESQPQQPTALIPVQESVVAAAEPATALVLHTRPPHTPPTYTREELWAKVYLEGYTRRIYVIIPKYKTGEAHYSQLTILQYGDKFLELMDKLQQSVAKKIIKQYKLNGRISRTSLLQLLTCIGSIDKAGDGMCFPEENYEWYLDAIAEARQLADIMDVEAERLREESNKGNIRYVDKLS